MPLSTSTSLPTSSSFLSSLLSTFPPIPQPHQPSTASTASPALSTATKPNLLTLHAIFPITLLPALDLLDRRLVTRFTLRDDLDNESTRKEGAIGRESVVYYVKSNAHRDGRSRYSRGGGDALVTSYEVRTEAWSCACAAFAFSAFNNAGASPNYEDCDEYEGFWGADAGVNEEDDEMLDVPERNGGGDRGAGWQWGGLMFGEEMPICKHLLACVLVERWDVARRMVEERQVAAEEMAGWAAGWGR